MTSAFANGRLLLSLPNFAIIMRNKTEKLSLRKEVDKRGEP